MSPIRPGFRPLLPILVPVLCVFIGLPVLLRDVDPMRYDGGRSRDVQSRAQRNSSSVGAMLGGLRTNLSDILFIKTERYLHAGVAYMPHMDAELMSIQGETAEYTEHEGELGIHDEEEEDDTHAGTPTLIRAAENDFRGFVGHLHRRVHPWRDPSKGHIHTSGTELLPWYRVMTMADPHNIRGYAIGAWWLMQINPDEAEVFLHEGLANNPGEFQLMYLLGRLEMRRADFAVRAGDIERGSEEFLAYHERALPWLEKAGRAGLEQRPPEYDGETDLVNWTHYVEEDFRAAMRMHVMLTRNLRGHETARQIAAEYLRSIDDGVLRRLSLAGEPPPPIVAP